MSEPIGIMAIDIETGGQLIGSAPIVAIGWCLGGVDGRVVLKGRVSLQYEPYHQFEKRCLEEYWYAKATQKAQLEAFRAEAVPIKQGLNHFLSQIRAAEGRYEKLYLVSDNPSFDFAFLNHYLAHFLGMMPLSYKVTDGQYRGQLGDEWYVVRKLTRNRFAVLPSTVQQVETRVSENVAHDHWPDNDAHHIYLKTVLLVANLAVS